MSGVGVDAMVAVAVGWDVGVSVGGKGVSISVDGQGVDVSVGMLGVGVSVGGVVGAATVAGCAHAEISNNTSVRRIRRLLIIFGPP
jgi:hypothetical protein